MEFRTRIEIPTFPGADHVGAPWEQLLDDLNAHAGELGPVLSGPHGDGRPGVEVILATDADDQAGAVRATVDAVTRSLEAIGLGEHYPARVEVEHAGAPEPARAAA